ncbi:MAG: hypothetical protein LBV30_10450 [Propionibacteriaceae bacterium]|jgi:hypothetical protein|nr:hypothetical protein [Propionibacteriaceae bacterium]
MRRRLLRLIPLAIATVAVTLSGILDPAHVLLLAGALALPIIVWPQSVVDLNPLPELPHHQRAGARGEPAALSWSAFERDGQATPATRQRIDVLLTCVGRPRLASGRDLRPLSALTVLDQIDHDINLGKEQK